MFPPTDPLRIVAVPFVVIGARPLRDGARAERRWRRFCRWIQLPATRRQSDKAVRPAPMPSPRRPAATWSNGLNPARPPDLSLGLELIVGVGRPKFELPFSKVGGAHRPQLQLRTPKLFLRNRFNSIVGLRPPILRPLVHCSANPDGMERRPQKGWSEMYCTR
jgi:hypothetical protein